MRIKAVLITVALGIAMTGCNTVPMSSNAAMAESVIAQKVSVAAEAQQDYLAILKEDTRLRYQRNNDFNNELVDVDYVGKPIPMLNAMATRYGYNLVEIGKYTDLHIINMRMKNVSPVEIMRSIAQQIDYAADLILDNETHTIRVVYK